MIMSVTNSLSLATIHCGICLQRRPPECLKAQAACAIMMNLKTASVLFLHGLCDMFGIVYRDDENMREVAKRFEIINLDAKIMQYLVSVDPFDSEDTVEFYGIFLDALETSIGYWAEHVQEGSEDYKVLVACEQEVEECKENLQKKS